MPLGMRADLYLVEQGVFETRSQAQAAIAAGRVRIGGMAIAKPSQKVSPGAPIEAEAAHPYVGRAALKLVAGIEGFGIDPGGRVCLDVGSSTGGFTEVLLARGLSVTVVLADPFPMGQLDADMGERICAATSSAVPTMATSAGPAAPSRSSIARYDGNWP